MLSKLPLALVLLLSAAALAADPVGWRTNGTGCYPAATPVTAWGADQNVVWKTPTDKWSNATPVLVEGKLFLLAEPDTLLCLNAADGAPLWSHANPREDTMTEADQALAAQQSAEYDKVNAEFQPVQKERNDARRKLQNAEKDLKKAQEARKKADATAPQDAAKQTPAPQAASAPSDEELAALQAAVDELKAQEEALKQQAAPFEKRLGELSEYRLPSTHGENGYTSSTPVSDGKNVYALFGTGVIAAYTGEGERRWIRFLAKPRQGWGHCMSPLLVDGKLIAHVEGTMFALNPETGETLWKQSVPHAWGSPVAATMGDTALIVSAKGVFLRASDGAVLAKAPVKTDYNAPLVVGDTVYFIENGGKAFRMTGIEGDALTLEELWKTEIPNDRYYASPILHDGLIYAIMQKGVFSVIDAKDGKPVYSESLKLGGTAYPSVALAGGYVFVSSDSGATAVLEPGRELKVLATNKLERFRSCPVFDGSRMFVRGYQNVYCIGK